MSIIERMPPQSIEAEQALLGAILVNNRVMEKVADFLKANHFANPVHGKIFEACQNLIERGRIADPLTVKEFFIGNDELKDVGGEEYILKLASESATLINAVDYARQIFDRFLRRELIDVGTDIVNNAFEISLEADANLQIADAESRLYELANIGELDGGPVAFKTPLKSALLATERAMKDPEGLSGLPTGLVDMDRMMGGLHDTDLIILAGRPAMGKTSLATCMAFNIAKFFQKENAKGGPKRTVAFFSLEMSAEQLAGRILSSYTHIEGHAFRTGKLTSEQFDSIANATTMLADLPLMIDETPGITVGTIKNRARRLKRDKEKGLGLIVIDYLQLITASGRNDSRVQEVSAITRSLKIMAKELGVPVLVLSQLSRQLEQRENKRPQLSDLRESGSIEQDADIVMFVYRDAPYMAQDKPILRPKETMEAFNKRVMDWEQKKVEVEKVAEAIIAKQRHGPTGTVNLFFNGQFTEFGNLEK